MEEIELEDFNNKFPGKLFVSVIMEKRPSDHAWADFSYEAIGVVTSDHLQDSATKKIFPTGRHRAIPVLRSQPAVVRR